MWALKQYDRKVRLKVQYCIIVILTKICIICTNHVYLKFRTRFLAILVNMIYDVFSYWWPWWRHQMETFSPLLVICVGNSPVSGEFPAQRPLTRSFDVFFDLCPNKRLSKQSWGWWFEMPSGPIWRHSNAFPYFDRCPTKLWIDYTYGNYGYQSAFNVDNATALLHPPENDCSYWLSNKPMFKLVTNQEPRCLFSINGSSWCINKSLLLDHICKQCVWKEFRWIT